MSHSHREVCGKKFSKFASEIVQYIHWCFFTSSVIEFAVLLYCAYILSGFNTKTIKLGLMLLSKRGLFSSKTHLDVQHTKRDKDPCSLRVEMQPPFTV